MGARARHDGPEGVVFESAQTLHPATQPGQGCALRGCFLDRGEGWVLLKIPRGDTNNENDENDEVINADAVVEQGRTLFASNGLK